MKPGLAALVLLAVLCSSDVTSAFQSQSTADDQRIKEEAKILEREIHSEAKGFTTRPRKKFISDNTTEYVYATYMHEWVERIERVGNLNYPQQAREQHLHGNVILTVGLNRDGSIYSIDVTQSSGYSVLDKSAIAIVKMSAPFPPLPRDNKEKVDLLYITRTWQFQPADVPKAP